MGMEQVTNIAIKIGELGTKVDFTFWVAIISAIAAIGSAAIAGIFAWKLDKVNKEHHKQWSYVAKTSSLIDDAIEIFSRMLFNKILIAYYNDQQAQQNLFLLQKDLLTIESKMVVYGSLELAEAIANFKNLIVQTPDKEFLLKWEELYKKGHEYLLKCRGSLGTQISESFEEFKNKLVGVPPEGVKGIVANTMGTITIEKHYQ